MQSLRAKNRSDSSPPLLDYGRHILRQEGEALLALAEQLDPSFLKALDLITQCQGSVIVSGIGKAGLIGQKITATLASTGSRSHFLHPAEAMHGDLGRIHADDIMLILSYSGETGEISRMLPSLRAMEIPIIAITASVENQLAKNAQVVLPIGKMEEACALGLAPSTSTTTMLALGDALALAASRHLGFESKDFARNHPGGSLGQQLAKVEEIMRPLDECRTAYDYESVRDIFVKLSRPGRRTGAVMLLDKEGLLSGIFTDSDLARLFELRRDAQIDLPIAEVMAQSPTTTEEGTLLPRALEAMAKLKISELPVVDKAGRPIGLIDVTDLLGYQEKSAKDSPSSAPPRSLPQKYPSPATVPFPSHVPGRKDSSA